MVHPTTPGWEQIVHLINLEAKLAKMDRTNSEGGEVREEQAHMLRHFLEKDYHPQRQFCAPSVLRPPEVVLNPLVKEKIKLVQPMN